MSEATETKRYDILILSEKPDFQLADGGVRALLRFMGGKRWISDVEEAVAQEWAELYMKPGPSSHEMFVAGSTDSAEPVFEEMLLRIGPRTVPQPYGGDEALPFYMELRGCRYHEPRGLFRKAMLDLLHLRVRFVTRDAEPLPPHATVGDDEQPEDPKKRGDARAGGAVGTRVEEF